MNGQKARTQQFMKNVLLNFWSRGETKTLLSEYFEIEEEYYLSTFPWLLFHGRFKP